MRAYPSRRRLVPLAAAVAAFVASAAAPSRAGVPPPEPPPAFQLAAFDFGVGAFEVTRTSAILWTRAGQSSGVVLHVSTSRPPTGGRVFELQPRASNDGTVQKHVTGLRPGTTYFYRFSQPAYGLRSRVGRFTTAPPADANRTIRFALSGDADAQHAHGHSQPFYNGLPGNNGLGAESFGVYQQMALEHNDFNVNLGDTIYSDSEVGGAGPALTVPQKWAKYRQNLALVKLRNLRRTGAVYNHWDDHEFINDFTKAENGSAIYDAGVTAFRDYMPVRYTRDTGLYNHQRWGRNLEVFRLDERSFRSAKASANHTCDNPDTQEPDLAPTAPQSTRNTFALLIPSFSQPVSQACKARIRSPNRTLLGKPQLERFLDDVRSSTATWKVIVNEVPIQQFYALPYDRWEGYEAERKELLRRLQRRGVENVIFLTTDTHANMLNVVRFKTLEQGGPVPSKYQEFVTGPVSTMTFQREIDEATGNPNAGALIDAVFFSPPPPNGVGMRCSNINVYSYAEVQAGPNALTVTAKDVRGNVVRDQSDNATPCITTLAP